MKILSVKEEKKDIVFEVELDKKEWAKALANEKKNIVKNIQIPGFRKGHVPQNLINERVDANQVKAQALRSVQNKMINDLFASKQFEDSNGIESINEMEIVKLEEDEAPVVKIHCDLVPEVEGVDKKFISNIEIPENKGPEIPENYIEYQIKGMIKKDAMVSAKEDGTVADGNIAVINFKGFVDDKAFAGGEAKGFELEIGSKSFIGDFEEQLIGCKKGDKKDVKVDFPKDYHAAELAGKPAKFEVEIVDVKEIEYPEINKAYLKKFNIDAENKKELVAYFKKMMKQQAELQYNDAAIRIINEKIASAVKLSHYPEGLLANHRAQLLDQYEKEAVRYGFKNLADLKKAQKVDEAEFNKRLNEDAKKYLGLALAIDKLIDAYEIKVTAADKKDFIEKLAKFNQTKADKAEEVYEKNKDYYEAIISREKLFKKLIEEAKKVDPEKKAEKK